MKYGEALPLRSVQEWLPYNLDYAEIKQLIKQYTTATPAVSDPNQPTDYEDELFEVFEDQLERITLFVKSKAGEIDRRIAACQRQVTELQKRPPTRRTAPKIANRYVKLEQDVERAGHDVQLLSRFANAQRTGFYKLLKKYRKWSGSSSLPDRLTVLLESPTAFHRQDFDQKVLQVSELLVVVRSDIASLSDPTTFKNDDEIPQPQQQEDRTRSYLDMDVAFGTSRIADHRNRAIFWVHTDYLIELQMFLLKHLTLQPTTPPITAPATPMLSRRNSGLTSGMTFVGKEDDIGWTILDDLNELAHAERNTTLDVVTQTPVRTAGQVRWCARDSSAAMVISDNFTSKLHPEARRNPDLTEVKLKRKYIQALVDRDDDVVGMMSGQNVVQRRDIDKVRTWLSSHPSVSPLAKILCRRIRFSGSIVQGKAWAFLDHNIRMYANPGTSGWAVSDSDDGAPTAVDFPHAVLELQWDGIETPDFIQELLQSHFVENVPGFSLDVHAIATLYQPKNVTPPFWFAVLGKDIRKTPDRRPMHSRRNSSRVVFSTSSSKTSSTAGAGTRQYDSTPITSDSAFSNYKSKRKKSNDSDIKSLGSRYWNEFDDEEEDEPYTIVIRPTTSDSSEDDDVDNSLSEFVFRPIRRYFSHFSGKKTPQGRTEFTPLLSEMTDVDSDDEPVGRISRRRHYGTVSRQQETPPPSTNHVWFLAVSFVTLFVTGAIALDESLSTHKRKRKNIGKFIAIDLSVFTGVLISLACAAAGLSLFVARGNRGSKIHQIYVWGAFIVICIASGAILTMVATAAV